MKNLLLCCLVCCVTCWATFSRADVSPLPAQCAESIGAFAQTYQENEVFRLLMDKAFKNMQPLPAGYHPEGNPWIGKNYDDLLAFLGDWCLFLPRSKGSSDDGLAYIEVMDFFAYQNPFGKAVFQISPGRELFEGFVRGRGAFMDSPVSREVVAQWLANPRTEKEDYLLPDPGAPDGGFASFNKFFARTFKDQSQSRPQTMPERDYVISAPTDAIMNSIPVPIVDNSTRLRTKGTQELNIQELLAGSKHWERFVGGTALSSGLYAARLCADHNRSEPSVRPEITGHQRRCSTTESRSLSDIARVEINLNFNKRRSTCQTRI